MKSDPRTYDGTGLVPPALGELVASCVSLDPAERPQTAAELRDVLDQILGDAGMGDPDGELAAFVADQAGYLRAFPSRLLSASPASLASRGHHARRGAGGARDHELSRRG